MDQTDDSYTDGYSYFEATQHPASRGSTASGYLSVPTAWSAQPQSQPSHSGMVWEDEHYASMPWRPSLPVSSDVVSAASASPPASDSTVYDERSQGSAARPLYKRSYRRRPQSSLQCPNGDQDRYANNDTRLEVDDTSSGYREMKLSERDQFLLALRQQDTPLSWKTVASDYAARFNEHVSVTALQMRYKRLRERLIVEPEHEYAAIAASHQWYRDRKWQLISERAKYLSGLPALSPRVCAAQWRRHKPDRTALVSTTELEQFESALARSVN